jgi:small-conductance mechanosensitive channel
MFVARLLIFSFAALLALDNLGVQIKPLLAGLGIGGIAIALAVQTVLGDLFASLSITLDKPFEIGDSLLVDDANGTVERIGIKSTRLRSLNGEQIIISNAELLKSRVRNFKRMSERRYAFTVGVAYETPRELLAEVPAIIEAAVRAQPKTRFDRCHLLKLGDSSLLFETVYIVTEADYQLFADTQQAINFRLLEEFGERGIMFAYPTQRNINEDVVVRSPS